MRDRSVRQVVRACLALAVAAATVVAIAAKVGRRNHIASRPPPSAAEPGWNWNDDVRIDICLSLRGAPGTSRSDEANLQIEGTLLGSGGLPPGAREPMDIGNVIACNDEPQRYIVRPQDDSRQTWRIMYAMTALDPSPFPDRSETTAPRRK